MNVAILVLALLLVLLFIALWYAVRWIRMRRRDGVYVALRWDPDRERSGWHLGIGRYRGEDFAWYRVWSLRRGPDRIFERENLTIADRREPIGVESYAVPPGATVLRCYSRGQNPVEVAMGSGALTGFLSWLESAPPGRRAPGN